MPLNAAEKNVRDTVKYLLLKMEVKVSSIGLEEDLILHPDFPSLAAISDALTEWQVKNIAARLSVEHLKDVQLPALVYLNIRGGIFAPLKIAENNMVEWLDTSHGWQKESIDTFSQHWDGTCLIMEPQAISGELQYKENRAIEHKRNAKNIAIVSGIAMILLVFLSNRRDGLSSVGSFYFYSLLLKFIGIVIGGLILWQSLKDENQFLQHLCHLGGDCNSILQSNAAKMTSWLSWSEIGFFYFLGGFISLFLVAPADQISLWSGLSVLSFLALPFTVYSIWYQGFVVRQWCVLCTTVQIILWCELAVALSNIKYLTWHSIGDSLELLSVSLIIPILIWLFGKVPLQRSKQIFELRKQLNRIKFDESYIKALFGSQRHMPPIFEGMRTVKIGHPFAHNRLTVVTNPLCGPCAIRHLEIEELLKIYPDVNCEFVLLGNSIGSAIASVFLNAPDEHLAATMHSWYRNSRQNADLWLKSHGRSLTNAKIDSQLGLHARWCQLAGISATPTIFLNGVQLPQAFMLKDVKKLGTQLKNVTGETVSII